MPRRNRRCSVFGACVDVYTHTHTVYIYYTIHYIIYISNRRRKINDGDTQGHGQSSQILSIFINSMVLVIRKPRSPHSSMTHRWWSTQRVWQTNVPIIILQTHLKLLFVVWIMTVNAKSPGLSRVLKQFNSRRTYSQHARAAHQLFLLNKTNHTWRTTGVL